MTESKIAALIKMIILMEDSSAIEDSLALQIDDLPSVSNFADIGVCAACRICSRVRCMKIETAQSIISLFFKRYGLQSLHLLASIECGSIGTESRRVLSPFLIFPLLREAFLSPATDDCSFDVDWAHMFEEEHSKKASLESALVSQTSLVSLLKALSGLAEVERNASARPEALNEDIAAAAERGDTPSVAFLLSKDPSLLEKRDEDDHFLSPASLLFAMLLRRGTPRPFHSYS
jgi:hypothetical protein